MSAECWWSAGNSGLVDLPFTISSSFQQDSQGSGDAPSSLTGPLGNGAAVEQFVIEPAKEGTLVKCRISRDRKGMDRGLFPTYFLHVERDDGKKVCKAGEEDRTGREIGSLETVHKRLVRGSGWINGRE